MAGMAVRLAVDLGLHLDPEPYVQIGLISAEEGRIRKIIWGGVFVHDRYLCLLLRSITNAEQFVLRMWSLYVGRPVALDGKHITVKFLAEDRDTGQVEKYWTPYDDGERTDLLRMMDPIDVLSVWNVKLCGHMTAIRENL